MKVISPKRLMQSVFPTVRNGSIFNASSLDLQFARTKTLDPRVTFTRASSGTYVDSQGVIRTATTNLLLRSEEFDNASWAKTACSVTANVHSSPSGLVTADKIVEDNTIAQRYVSQFITVAAATQTISFYAKGDGRTIAIFYADNGNVGQGFVLTGNGSLQGNFGASAPTSATIQAVGNGWYRCSATWATTAGSTAIRIYPAANTSSPVYQGDGTSGIYLWGAQLEQSSTVGEYIPTTSTINSAPRFDHNPTTGESLGLLVEEQRTNLLLRSEEFDNASWSKIRSTVSANGTLAPNGTTTADKFTEDTTASNTHIIVQGASVTSGTTYAASFYLKAGERSSIYLSLSVSFAGGTDAIFNASTGVATNLGVTSCSMTPVGNGWYRCVAIATANATGTGNFNLYSYNGSTIVYTGDGTSGIFIWGAQLEAGSFPTSYIPTTTAAVTRSADVASITGSNFSSWYRQDEGTVFFEGVRNRTTGFPQRLTIDDGTNNNRIFWYFDAAANSSTLTVVASSISQGDIFGGGGLLGFAVKAAIGIGANNISAVYSGTVQGTDTSVILPVVTQLVIGSGLGGTIRRLTYWPSRLSNTTLQRITQ